MRKRHLPSTFQYKLLIFRVNRGNVKIAVGDTALNECQEVLLFSPLGKYSVAKVSLVKEGQIH